MDKTTIEQTIRRYLPQVIHMSLATVADNKPWVFEVHYAFDDDLNLYIVTSRESRHGQEVAKNANVSGIIVTQHFLDQPARGVSFEGTMIMLEQLSESDADWQVYTKRFPDRADAVQAAYRDTDAARRMYRITVSNYYLIDGIASGRPEKHLLEWKS